MKQTILLLLFLSVTGYVLGQEQLSIAGKVISQEDNSPLVGVNVVVKGSTTGTQTDVEGNYRLNAPGNATLVFSYIGFTPLEVPINNQTTISPVMAPDVRALSEVVVVGYGTQRKADVTGSIASVQAEDIANRPVSNAEQALQGKAAGVLVTTNQGTPGAAPNVQIRGTGTTGNSNPLYIVDGMFVDDIRFLNPGDIAAINVLKDASSLAIYGVRGANGVVIITTKGGQPGKTSFSYDGYAGFTQVLNRIDMANATQYATLINEAVVNTDPGATPPFANPTALGEGTDWFDQIFQRGLIQSHQVSASGGTEKMTYNISGNYFSQEGIVKTSKYDRFTLRFNNTYQATDFLKLGNNVALTYDQTARVPGGVIQTAYMMDPTVPVYDANGNYGFSGISNVGNPVAQLDYNDDKERGGRIVGNIFAELSFLKGFSLRSSYGTDLSLTKTNVYTPVYRVSAVQNNPRSRFEKTQRTTANWLWENTLTYTRTIGNIHNVTALVGYTAQQNYYESLGGTRFDVAGYSRDVQYLRLGNPVGQSNTDEAGVFTYQSYLFRINYNLKERYLLTASLRRDGSSRFPTNNRFGIFPAIGLGWRLSEEPFIRDLGLFDNLKLRASYGRLGNTNIPNYLYYPRIANNLNAVFGQGQIPQIGATELNPVATGLLWETVTQTDIGLEIGVLNNRLTFEADYYNRQTNDLILKARRPVVGEIETNTASAVNRGFEFAAGWNEQRGDFQYSIGGNLTTVHNEVTDLGNGGVPLIGGSLGNGLTSTITNVGSPIGAFYGYKVLGVFQPGSDIAGSAQPNARPGDLIFADVNGRDDRNQLTGQPDGTINGDDRVFLGTPIPKVFWGLNTSFGYRGFDLIVDVQGNHGNKIYNGKRAVRFGNENYEAVILDRWTAQNPSNAEPRVTNGGQNYQVSDYFIESGSFVRIRNVQFGYSIPSGLLERSRLKTARLYISALNPVTFTKYSGFTPEVGIADPANQTASINRGIDVNIVPTYATYTIGLNIGF